MDDLGNRSGIKTTESCQHLVRNERISRHRQPISTAPVRISRRSTLTPRNFRSRSSRRTQIMFAGGVSIRRDLYASTGEVEGRGSTRATEADLPDLMARYQRGDSYAVEELVRRLSPSLMRYFSTGLNAHSDAEDLLQDCWIRIHRSRHTYRSPEPVVPWIFAIARHTRLDGYRRRRRREKSWSRNHRRVSPPARRRQRPSETALLDCWRICRKASGK